MYSIALINKNRKKYQKLQFKYVVDPTILEHASFLYRTQLETCGSYSGSLDNHGVFLFTLDMPTLVN